MFGVLGDVGSVKFHDGSMEIRATHEKGKTVYFCRCLLIGTWMVCPCTLPLRSQIKKKWVFICGFRIYLDVKNLMFTTDVGNRILHPN